MDEKSWHGVREHLVGEFWVILLTMEPPSQTKILAQIESKSADKAPDVAICSSWCFEEMGEDLEPLRGSVMIWSQTWAGGGCVNTKLWDYLYRLYWCYTNSCGNQANRVLLLDSLLYKSPVSRVTFICVFANASFIPIIFIQTNHPVSVMTHNHKLIILFGLLILILDQLE